MVWRRRESMKQ